jgi:hypothetical protein
MSHTFRTLIGAVVVLSAVAPTTRAGNGPGERYLRLASRQGISSFQEAAYVQLARLSSGDYSQWLEDHDFGGKAADNPMARLFGMGLDVLPVLVKALDDGTPTKTATEVRPGRKRRWKANELVALLISRISDRVFAIVQGENEVDLGDVGTHPDLIPQFQKLVLAWYIKNAKKTLAERRIADVDSDVLRNRLDAIEWIGEHREKAGQKAILDRIDAIFAAKKASSSVDAELAACALALGRIGDKATTHAVRRICKHFSYWTYMSYRPLTEGRSGRYSSQDYYLFRAYQGLALLGAKDEALRELRRLYDAYSSEMEPGTRKEFQNCLEAADRW